MLGHERGQEEVFGDPVAFNRFGAGPVLAIDRAWAVTEAEGGGSVSILGCAGKAAWALRSGYG